MWDMGKNYLDHPMARRLMTRLSSASMEPDCIPPMVPFDWEAAPGRPATVKSEIAAAPALPLPPGRRPKDGPISRPAQVPNEEGTIDSSRRNRRSFHLKFPRALKKSRKARKICKDVEDPGSVFNPSSGHRFGSRVARRVLVESQKSSSCFGECSSGGKEESSSRVDHHRGKGLDSVEESDGEHYVTPSSFAASGSPLSSPRHGLTRNSLIAGAGTQLQVPSSRFNMASMLLSLCPESDESDGDEVRISQHLTTPRATVSTSNEARISTTPRAPVSNSDKVRIPEHLTTPRVPVSNSSRNRKLQQASILLSLCPDSDESDESDESDGDEVRISKHLTTPGAPVSNSDNVRISEHLTTPRAPVSRNRKLQQARPGSDEFTNKCNAMVQSWSTPWSSCGSSDCSFVTSCSLDDPKAEVESGSFATPTAEFSPHRRNPFEERLEPNQPPATRPISSLPQISLRNHARLQITKGKAVRIEDKKVPNSWLEELQSSPQWPKMSAHGDAGKGDNGDESGEDFESSSSHSFEHRTPKAGPSIPSPNSPVFNTSQKPAIKCVVVSKEVLKSSSLLQRKIQRQQSYESPRSSFMLDQETTTAPNSAFEQNDATASTVLTHAPNSSDHASKGENPAVLPATRLSETLNSSSGAISKAAQGEFKAEVGSSGESFPIYLRRRGSTIIKAKAMSRCGSGSESGEDSEDNSTDSLEHGTKGAGSPIPSMNSPVFCKVKESLETETWVASEVSREVLKSSSFNCKLQRQVHSMGLRTKSLHIANHIEDSRKDAFEHGTPRAVSPTPSLNSPIFFKFNTT